MPLASAAMVALIYLLLALLLAPFRSKLTIEAENAALRQQIIVLRCKLRGRVKRSNADRAFFVWLFPLFPSITRAMLISPPYTLVRWHRVGFRCYWRWRSRGRIGRPRIARELRALIRRTSEENQLWGAPRIHGELLKLGFDLAQSTVAKYMVKRRGPPSQTWGTFLRNHAPDIAAIDLFVVPTISFGLLYGLVVIRIARRNLVWVNVTAHPTAEWVARQLTEAFPWQEAPLHLIRDRDGVYGQVFHKRRSAMGIRDHPIAPGSPWQNAYAERLIGSIRREGLDRIVVTGEAHLRPVLRRYADYYNRARTHRSLRKDCPVSRPIQSNGLILSTPVLGGLHHVYART